MKKLFYLVLSLFFISLVSANVQIGNNSSIKAVVINQPIIPSNVTYINNTYINQTVNETDPLWSGNLSATGFTSLLSLYNSIIPSQNYWDLINYILSPNSSLNYSQVNLNANLKQRGYRISSGGDYANEQVAGVGYPYTISLKQGWNSFSMIPTDTGDYFTNRTIPITSGLNLLGYSSPRKSLVQNIIFTNATTSCKFYDCKFLNITLANNFNQVGNGALPYELIEGEAFWVNSQYAGNLTFQNVGGSLQNETYNWSDLLFSNGTDVKNITDAGDAGWIDNGIQYWGYNNIQHRNTYLVLTGDPGRDQITSWNGYFIYSHANNITLIRQDYNLTNKGKVIGDLGYFTNVTGNYITGNGSQLSGIPKIGNCPAGQVVMNTTTNGVQCVAMSSGVSSLGNGTIGQTAQWFNNTFLIGVPSFNKTYADTLYAAIANAGNASWNESYADSKYIDYSVKLNYDTNMSGSTDTKFDTWKTLGFWIKSNNSKGSSNYAGGIGKQIDDPSVPRWSVQINGAGRIYVFYLTSGGTNGWNWDVAGNYTLQDNNWHYVELDTNTTYMKVFLDGKQIGGQRDITGASVDVSNSLPLMIKTKSATSSPVYFDEIAFYNQTVHWNANYTPERYNTNYSNLVALFRFNDFTFSNITYSDVGGWNLTINKSAYEANGFKGAGVKEAYQYDARTAEENDAKFVQIGHEVTLVDNVSTTEYGTTGSGESLMVNYPLGSENPPSETQWKEIHIFGTFASNTNLKGLRFNLYINFEGDDYNEEILNTGTAIANGGAWDARITEQYDINTDCYYFQTTLQSSTSLLNKVQYTRSSTFCGSDLSQPDLQIYGTGTSSNDVLVEGWTGGRWGAY